MNISAMAAKGLNDKIISNILNDIKNKNLNDTIVSILDLGSGQGYNAFCLAKYLTDLKIKYKIICVDINKKQFNLDIDNVFFVEKNLNENINLGEFDFVVGTEIIEHLENPYFFINLCVSSLKVGGVCYLTSPNIDHLFSLIKQIFFGRPMWFSVDEPSGHIMPIHKFMILEGLRRISNLNGRKFIVRRTFNRNCWPVFLRKNHLHFIKILGKNRFFGEINIFRISDNI